MDLRFDVLGAYAAGETDHPHYVIRRLGITYREGIPQSIADQWWFYGCENVPDVLPAYLTEMKSRQEQA